MNHRKQMLYEKAVQRNLRNAERVYRRKYLDIGLKHRDNSAHAMSVAKHKLGIRRDDARWDDRVRNLITKS